MHVVCSARYRAPLHSALPRSAPPRRRAPTRRERDTKKVHNHASLPWRGTHCAAAPRHGARQSKLNVYCACVCVCVCVCACVCVRVGRPGTHTKKVAEKAFSFVVWLIFVICAVSLDTTTSLPFCIHRLAVVRSVHASVDLWSGPYTLA